MRKPDAVRDAIRFVVIIAATLTVVWFIGRDLRAHRLRAAAEHVCGYEAQTGLLLDALYLPRDENVPYGDWRGAQLDHWEREFVACSERRSHQPTILEQRP